MNYTIIINSQQLQAFIEWLPELKAHEKFYCCLFSRKKYIKTEVNTSGKAQLKRFLARKDRLFDKIKQLEVPFGSYKYGDDAAPQESLALYINPNPRDLKKASYDSIIELTRLLKKDQASFNPHAEVMNCIQRSSSKKTYLDFDVDTKDFDFKQLSKVVNTDCLQIVETRGGYHILVELDRLDPAFKKTFYQDIKALGVDQTGDQLLPVPGCVQGGFTPRFIKW